MLQIAIKGIYKDKKIIPLEEFPFSETMNVIIVFTDKYDEQARYYEPDWQLAEKTASKDYIAGNVKSADSIEQMFEEIERNADEIAIDMSIRITLQEFEDHIYFRNIGRHKILP